MAPTINTLRAMYGLSAGMKRRSVINVVIRRDWPGGMELLDVTERLHQMQHGRPRPDPALQDMLDKLGAARDKIAEAILSDSPSLLYLYSSVSIPSPNTSGETPQACQTPAPVSILAKLLGTMPDTALAADYGVSHTTVANMRRKMGIPPYAAAKPRVDWGKWDASLRNKDMTAEGLASLIGCDVSTVRERHRLLRGENSKYKGAGRPQKGSAAAVDWTDTDWSLSDAEISRGKGVTRQAAAAARKRHAKP